MNNKTRGWRRATNNVFQNFLILIIITIFFCSSELHFFSQESEVRFVGNQRKHDQIGIKAIQAMSLIRLVSRLRFSSADELHDFVLPFPRNLRARYLNTAGSAKKKKEEEEEKQRLLQANLVSRENDLAIPPGQVLVNLFPDKILDVLGEAGHERRPGSDAVRIEHVFLVGNLLPFLDGECSCGFCLLGGTESSLALLVHLCPRGDPCKKITTTITTQ